MAKNLEMAGVSCKRAADLIDGKPWNVGCVWSGNRLDELKRDGGDYSHSGDG